MIRSMFANRAGMQAHLDMIGAELKMDAGETAFFARELEHIEPQTYDIKYPDLKARQLMSMGSGLTPADEFLTWRQFDRMGDIAEQSMDSDEIPVVDVQGQEVQSKVVPLVVGYEYTVQDIRQAMAANRPLDAMKAFAARDLIERKLEVMAAIGSNNAAANKVYGMLNQPNVPIIGVTADSTTTAGYSALATGAANSGAVLTWGPDAGGFTKTPKEILRDLFSWRNQVQALTNGVEEVDSLILDLVSYNYINTTQVNDADTAIFTEGTILSYIMRNVPWLKRVDYWLPAAKMNGTRTATSPNVPTKGPGTHGSTSNSRAMLYKKDPRNFSFFVPQEFEQFAPQLRNFKFFVPCHARCAGVVCRYPRSAVYVDGLQP